MLRFDIFLILLSFIAACQSLPSPRSATVPRATRASDRATSHSAAAISATPAVPLPPQPTASNAVAVAESATVEAEPEELEVVELKGDVPFPHRHMADFLTNLQTASVNYPSTRKFRRRGPGKVVSMNLELVTNCDVRGCQDSLKYRDQWLIPPSKGKVDPHERFDRYITVVRAHFGYVSVLVGEQMYYEGAAHYNYAFHCRTFDDEHKRPLRLQDLLGRKSEQILLRNFEKFTHNCGIYFGRGYFPCDEGPSPPPYWPEDLQAEDFRVEQVGVQDFPRIVLCQSGVDQIVEVPLDKVPITVLLRPISE